MITIDEGRHLLNHFALQAPDVVALAEVVSLTAAVRPELLRAARLQLVPAADGGTEADLWFSPLVQSAGPSGLVLEPWAVGALWERLAGDQERLDRSYRLTRQIHRHAAPTVRLADKLTWLGLAVHAADRAARIDRSFRQVLAALVAEERDQLAYWIHRILPRLPVAVRAAPSYAPLAWAAMARLPNHPALPVETPPEAMRDWLPAILPKTVRMLTVGLLRRRGALEFQVPPAGAAFSFEVPALTPVMLEIADARGRQPATVLTLSDGGRTIVPVDEDVLEIRTALGTRYRVPAELEVESASYRFTTAPDGTDVGRLGAVWDGRGVNFALFSAHATKVELCLFDAVGRREIQRLPLPECTDDVWHGYIQGAGPGLVYGYRVHGPYEPEAGHRFNPNKLLLDPYAKALVGSVTWNPALFGYVMESGDDTTFDTRDSAPFTRKCRVIDPAFTWGHDQKPDVPWDKTILYETHIKGFTKLHPAVPEHLRGTYAGLGSPEVLAYIQGLGVTSVELLPVHSFIDEMYLLEKGLVNYWGYNTLSFFAPAGRYAAEPEFATSEFKEMVAGMHGAGLEVILDVVYNSTAEGNEKGPTLSFRGIDNASYYRLLPNQPRYYINDTGTGNTLSLTHPRVLQMVTDSLRYWAQEMHVDGFRFDLATILGREPYGFDEDGSFFRALRQDPVLSRVKLIAEPWDVGPGGYQAGGFPPGWAEWNDRFRDDVRGYWKGDAGLLPGLASRITASADKFNRPGRRPWASVNFITAHDGFTLNDTVSYNEKHNAANGEGNRDGHGHNLSYNYGVEGPTDDPEIRSVRLRQMRNMLATLFLSQGTPMLQAGDEFGRTQHGNNNAYCQDNELSWLDWGSVDDYSTSLRNFTRRLIALRGQYPMLSMPVFLDGKPQTIGGQILQDVSWIDATGAPASNESWQDPAARCIGMLLDGRVIEGAAAQVQRLLLVILNGDVGTVRFLPPKLLAKWILLLDTADPETTSRELNAPERGLDVVGRSLVVLEGRPEPIVAG